MKVIAVDFDGCLCENRWPEIGRANVAAIGALIRRRAQGDKVILWTCRSGELLEAAVCWCAKRGLLFVFSGNRLKISKSALLEYCGYKPKEAEA